MCGAVENPEILVTFTAHKIVFQIITYRQSILNPFWSCKAFIKLTLTG
jgi:hypothetical protein